MFYFTVLFDKKHSKSLQTNVCGRNYLIAHTPQAFIFFLNPPLQNVGLKIVPQAERGGGGRADKLSNNLGRAVGISRNKE